MFSVHDQRGLVPHLLRIVGQRLAHVILNASESTERANRLSRLPTQISSWIKSQVRWPCFFHHIRDSDTCKLVSFDPLTDCSKTNGSFQRFAIFQDPTKLQCRTVPLSHTVDLLRVVLSVTPEDSPDYPLTSGLAESIKFLL